MILDDARVLKLVQRFTLPSKLKARSLYWHEIDMRPCLCETLHGHCRAVQCPCGGHEGEMSR